MATDRLVQAVILEDFASRDFWFRRTIKSSERLFAARSLRGAFSAQNAFLEQGPRYYHLTLIL